MTTASSEAIEWGVRHEHGLVTIAPTGHGFVSRMTAEREAANLDLDCEYCAGTSHTAVCQKINYMGWVDAAALSAGPLALP